MVFERCSFQHPARRLLIIWAGGLLLAALATSCNRACEGFFLGHSTVEHQLTREWPYGDGTAAGVWKLTLDPDAFGTNCIELAGDEYPAELYAYTLEFVEDGGQERMNVYVEGVLFAAGTYTDEPEESESPDTIRYMTEERTDESRPEGAISYTIEGFARLEANTQAASLTWTGYEEIRVTSSEDPNIGSGCVFTYDVTGTKVCDE